MINYIVAVETKDGIKRYLVRTPNRVSIEEIKDSDKLNKILSAIHGKYRIIEIIYCGSEVIELY